MPSVASELKLLAVKLFQHKSPTPQASAQGEANASPFALFLDADTTAKAPPSTRYDRREPPENLSKTARAETKPKAERDDRVGARSTDDKSKSAADRNTTDRVSDRKRNETEAAADTKDTARSDADSAPDTESIKISTSLDATAAVSADPNEIVTQTDLSTAEPAAVVVAVDTTIEITPDDNEQATDQAAAQEIIAATAIDTAIPAAATHADGTASAEINAQSTDAPALAAEASARAGAVGDNVQAAAEDDAPEHTKFANPGVDRKTKTATVENSARAHPQAAAHAHVRDTARDSATPTDEVLESAQPQANDDEDATAGETKPAQDATRVPAPDRPSPGNDTTSAARPTIDPVQGLAAATSGLHAVTRAANAHAAFVAAPAALDHAQGVPFQGIAVEIAAQARNGVNRFEIRLDPPELGRIDVRLDVDRGGNVTSRLLVERAETLDLLRRDATQLERALQDAGLKTSDNGLQFSLRDQAYSQRDDASDGRGARIIVADEDAPIETATRGYRNFGGLGGGVDIRV
ncbi:MAG: flagellar hook-length control protein FliK [Rhizobiales bacterium]|nr:flagellar hook-length control protein FliK [Hyphomicrobiales bacterium]